MSNKIIVCPNELKIKLLKENDSLNNKYITKEEFINNYLFSYNDKTISYLIEKYKLNIDVCKEYKSNKLNFLKKLKLDLINNNLLTFNNLFKEYIKDKEIIVKGYYNLELYEEDILNYKFDIKNITDEIPLGRVGTPDAVSKCVEWLMEDDYTTGQVISINGGWSIN